MDVVSGGYDVTHGRVSAPTKPGLGIDVNETEANKHPFQNEVLMPAFRTDGSVTDW